MSACRIIPRRKHDSSPATKFVRFNFSMSFSTAPLIADLFLLAIQAIGRQEVHDGTVGADHISPLDVMVFFITLAYIAISIDASGLIRYLAFKVLQRGGKVGHLLFFYLYAFFFSVGAFIGNDPIILSGTAFLAYMTRVSSNISHPRAWIHAQFAIANIASAILVSSNPTNLVLAGAFQIRFIVYTANMIVPVVVTAIVLFPFLLYVVFANEELIPLSIKMHELSEEDKAKKPVNPNIPHAKGDKNEDEDGDESGEGSKLALEEIMNPFLDKGGAAFGAVIMTVALVTLLAINAASQEIGEHPVFWVTLPAAVIMFCWDVAYGWKHRAETREIARSRQEVFLQAQSERVSREDMEEEEDQPQLGHVVPPTPEAHAMEARDGYFTTGKTALEVPMQEFHSVESSNSVLTSRADATPSDTVDREKSGGIRPKHHDQQGPTNLVSFVQEKYRWSQETFPTVVAVVSHLPFKLVPFAFSMFVLIQGLVTKGWIPVFAYGWDHWVTKTGTIGSIGGMGFLSVILCNVSVFRLSTRLANLQLIVKHSLRAQISGQRFCCHESYRRGKPSAR